MGNPMQDDDPRSVEDRAADPEDPAVLFPMGALAGDGVMPQQLVKKGLPVEVTVSIGKAEVPNATGGLLDPNRTGRVMVSYAYGQTVEVPKVEGDRVVGWKIRQELRATYVQQANDEAALIRDEFAALIALDHPAAGRVLDELGRLFRDATASAA